MNEYHITVLLQETIDALQVKPGSKYLDATLGGGGHSLEIVRRGGDVLSVDTDPEALEHVRERIRIELSEDDQSRIHLVQANFKNLKDVAGREGFTHLSGIVFDLGVSGHQFDTGERGFSTVRPGPLDMRMNPELAVSARDLVNGLTQGELVELFTKLGEEPFARKIAQEIVRGRQSHTIETTDELAEIVRRAVPMKGGNVHPATRVFQALRIAVNDELNVLREALPQALELLGPRGRLAVISFHSLEDRIVKQLFQSFQEKHLGTVITDKPITPTEKEIDRNKRSRSAKLRVFEGRHEKANHSL